MRSSKRTETVGGRHKLLKSLKIIEKGYKFIAMEEFSVGWIRTEFVCWMKKEEAKTKKG